MTHILTAVVEQVAGQIQTQDQVGGIGGGPTLDRAPDPGPANAVTL
ncbi:hypothetical protein ACWCPQ_25450 [Nocardia sp. NPDC001965]